MTPLKALLRAELAKAQWDAVPDYCTAHDLYPIFFAQLARKAPLTWGYFQSLGASLSGLGSLDDSDRWHSKIFTNYLVTIHTHKLIERCLDTIGRGIPTALLGAYSQPMSGGEHMLHLKGAVHGHYAACTTWVRGQLSDPLVQLAYYCHDPLGYQPQRTGRNLQKQLPLKERMAVWIARNPGHWSRTSTPYRELQQRGFIAERPLGTVVWAHAWDRGFTGAKKKPA